jgi:hypothetical protein
MAGDCKQSSTIKPSAWNEKKVDIEAFILEKMEYDDIIKEITQPGFNPS